MTIDVRFHGLEATPELRMHGLRAIRVHLGRLAGEVSSVVVRVADVNGPKGGLDKRCRFHVRGPRIGALVIVQASADAASAIDAAAERAGRALARRLERLRAPVGEPRAGRDHHAL